MSKTYAMGQTTVRKPVTVEDPFLVIYDDGSYNTNLVYDTAEEAADSIPPRWRNENNKIVKLSEVPPEGKVN